MLLAGFAGLIKGADFFVDGSSGIAKYLRIPGLIIGLTIVAFGTSMPELAVSTFAAVRGSNEIALSNVLGSNIFNLLMVIGCCALISPVPTERPVIVRDIPVSIIAVILLFLSTGAVSIRTKSGLLKNLDSPVGCVGRIHGIILTVLFVIYIIFLLVNTKVNDSDSCNDKNESISIRKCLVFIISGLLLIIAGGQAVVFSAQLLARMLGMTETLIGLTIVAVGTSLPELVTSIVAARKNETDMAIGNAIGSNIFNVMFILGISSMLNPIDINAASAYDMLILVFSSILVLIFLIISGGLKKRHGLIMIMLYILDMAFAVLR